MRNKSPISILLALMALLGCGSAPPVAPAPVQNLSGNWQLQVQTSASIPVNLLFNFLGALTIQGSTATGTFRVSGGQPGSPCPSSTQDIAFNGSIDSSNVLTLTSASFNNSVATIRLQLPLTAQGIANGAVQIVGGACALPSAVILAILVPPVSGTYTGTLNPITGAGGTASISFTESPADPDGRFPLNVSFAFTSPLCTIPPTTLTGYATGLGFELSTPSPPAGTPTLNLSGGLPLSGLTSFHSALVISSSPNSCANGIYTGTFNP